MPEDPACGSSFFTLAPLWADVVLADPERRREAAEMRARFCSVRGGDVGVRLGGDRVTLRGTAAVVMQGSVGY